MATNIRTAFVSGTGTFVDALTSVTVMDTRVRAVNCVVRGGAGKKVVITGTSTDPFGNTIGNRISFQVGSDTYQEFADAGVRMAGKVSVTADASVATTIYYG
jgi:hypothetical protein